MRFTWDPLKRRENLRRHGIDFADAPPVFDRFLLERLDTRKAYLKDVSTGKRARATSRPRSGQRGTGHARKGGGRTDRRGSDRATSRGQTDWERVRHLTDAETVANAEADPTAPPTTAADWRDAVVVPPRSAKPLVSLRIDRDVFEWFRATGRGYQTRMNAVLRAYVEHQRKR